MSPRARSLIRTKHNVDCNPMALSSQCLPTHCSHISIILQIKLVFSCRLIPFSFFLFSYLKVIWFSSAFFAKIPLSWQTGSSVEDENRTYCHFWLLFSTLYSRIETLFFSTGWPTGSRTSRSLWVMTLLLLHYFQVAPTVARPPLCERFC